MLASADQCNGCGACTVVCPHNCISMFTDAEGFRYPIVDTQKCVSCMLCQRSCPVLSKSEVSELTIALGAKNKDLRVRRESSSGGVFTALAEAIIKRDGAVCAARYDTDHNVIHSIAKDRASLAAFRGAKYAQGRAEHCYQPIKTLLNQGKTVLFVGTPCQCAGLKAFLNDDYPQLLTVDMICHGVPSPMVWQKYLQERSQTDADGASAEAVNLRSKASGWSHYRYSVEITYGSNDRYCVPQGQDPYMQGFVNNLYLRPSCADCAFKGIHRNSDITLGDFWGIWDLKPEFDDDLGTSLLLIHSEKGLKIWEVIRSGFDECTVSLENAVSNNSSAMLSSVPHPLRKEFFERIKSTDVIETIHMCLQPKKAKFSLLQRIRHWING